MGSTLIAFTSEVRSAHACSRPSSASFRLPRRAYVYGRWEKQNEAGLITRPALFYF
jgi:hypothetical protein